MKTLDIEKVPRKKLDSTTEWQSEIDRRDKDLLVWYRREAQSLCEAVRIDSAGAPKWVGTAVHSNPFELPERTAMHFSRLTYLNYPFLFSRVTSGARLDRSLEQVEP